MNQKLSLTGFATGLTMFLGTATELVTEHTQWSDFKTPLGVVHLLILGGSFVLMILGALGVQLPRGNGYADRSTDTVTTQAPAKPSAPPSSQGVPQ